MPAPGGHLPGHPHGTTLPITVGYSIAGSVVAGVDYKPLPGSVVIPAGATSEDIPMTTLNDPNMTDNLPFTVTLSSGAGYLLRFGSIAGRIAALRRDGVSMASLRRRNADGSGGVSVSFSGVEMESHVEGAWCRMPSESQYAVALGLNLSTNIRSVRGAVRRRHIEYTRFEHRDPEWAVQLGWHSRRWRRNVNGCRHHVLFGI